MPRRGTRSTTMKQLPVYAFLFFLGAGIAGGAEKAIDFFEPEDLHAVISGHTVNYDFLLLDVRDHWELAKGVIASRYCRPYHLSWAAGELQEHYDLLPDSMCILIYSQTGAPQSIDAANFLAGKGFPCIGCVNGGVRLYETVGELSDSSELKPLSLLPQPSYFADTTGVAGGRPVVRVGEHDEAERRYFTLQGRVVRAGNEADVPPMFLLMRQAGTTIPVRRMLSR